MMRSSLFSHGAAWAIVVVLLGGIAAPQICGAHIRSAQVSPTQVATATVELVPQDRPDRYEYDETAFTEDEMSHHPAPVRVARRGAIQP
jgi:hypothetical protein